MRTRSLVIFIFLLESLSFLSLVLATPPWQVLGVYINAADPNAVEQFGQWLGYNLSWAMDFFDGRDWNYIANPTWFLQQWNCQANQTTCSGFNMVWAVPILPNTSYTFAEGATGAYNIYFQQLAQILVSYGQGSSIIRLAWEFNGNWFPWSVNSSNVNSFISYWQQIVDTMRSVNSSFKFLWNPTRGVMYFPPDQAYPGDAYVDVIGLDVYDISTITNVTQRWEYMLNESYGLNWLANFSSQRGKPISLPEWGLWPVVSYNPGGGDNPYFIMQMAEWISNNNVIEATFWNNGACALDLYNMSQAEFLIAFAKPPPIAPQVASNTTSTSSPISAAPSTQSLSSPLTTPLSLTPATAVPIYSSEVSVLSLPRWFLFEIIGFIVFARIFFLFA